MFDHMRAAAAKMTAAVERWGLATQQGAASDGNPLALEAETRERVEAEYRRRRLIAHGRPPKDEMIARAFAAVDTAGDRAKAYHLAAMLDGVAGKSTTQPDGSFVARPPQLFQLPGALGLTELCWLAPDAVKAAFEAAIQAAEYAEGPRLADRPRLLAEINNRIAELEAEHEAIVDAAAGLGITIPLLPAVAQRREDARLREEREAHRRAEQARRETALNAAAARRGGRSEYLRDGRGE